VGLGGVGGKPVVIDIADALRGGLDDAALKTIGDRAYEGARHALADLNGSGEYRREMARVHARRAVQEATAMLLAGGRP
jgi:CO/xanthine dehydrogenase FAD-binding subunit